MPDTKRLRSELQAILADGQAAGAITPQDIRDFLVSVAMEDYVPTLEELEWRYPMPATLNATTTIYLGSTNFDQRIGGLTFAFTGAVAVNGTNWWTLELQRVRANGAAVAIVSNNTFTTGNAIAANTDWNYDNQSWTDANRYLLKGDTLRLVCTRTVTPSDLLNGVLTLRYEPGVVA